MADDETTPPDQRGFVWVLDCPCGERLRASSEDEIVDVAQAHLRERHDGLDYERDQILFMAMKFRA